MSSWITQQACPKKSGEVDSGNVQAIFWVLSQDIEEHTLRFHLS